MKSPEIQALLAEYDISAQERCLSCPRLASIAIELAHEDKEKKRVAKFIDPRHFIDVIRKGIVEYMIRENPQVTAEEIEAEVQEVASKYVNTELESELLQNMGALHEYHGTVAEALAGDIRTLLEACPPEGHPTA